MLVMLQGQVTVIMRWLVGWWDGRNASRAVRLP